MTQVENLNIFWKSLATELRKKFPKMEFLEDANFNGKLHAEVEILWKHADREDWWAFGPGLNWTTEELATVAFAIGKGFKFQVTESPMDAHDWKKSLHAEESILDIVHMARPNCVVCKSQNLLEIELLLARGTGLKKLSDFLKISETQLRVHRQYCMAERFARLEGALGFVVDTEAFLGAAGKLDKTFAMAEKLAMMAAERGELGAAVQFTDRMSSTAMLSAELSGEKKTEAPVQQGGMIGPGGHAGQVNVVVMPVRQKPPKIIDGTVIEEE